MQMAGVRPGSAGPNESHFQTTSNGPHAGGDTRGRLASPAQSRLRALNSPQPAGVKAAESGVPSEVLIRGEWRRCARIEEVWRVEDGWWRPKPIRRTYFRVALEDSLLATVYLDHAGGGWWQQRY